MRKIKKVLIMVKECLSMSIANIAANRVRSFLTLLGILIGVAAVIALITTVNGFSGSLTSSFSSMGAGVLTLNVSGSDLKSGLTSEDMEEITSLSFVDGVTPSVSLSARVSHGGEYDTGISVSGKNYYYFTENPDILLRGRTINITDEENSTFVCIISEDMLEDYFYGIDPIGEELCIDGIPFLVIGIMEEDSDSSISGMMNGSAEILIPYTTALKMNNSSDVTNLSIYLTEGTDSDDASDELEVILDAMFSYEDDCYSIQTMSSIEDTMDEILSMVSTLLAGIASIALIVGGIGIMNMMLTSVTERTSEIGLKKALGAQGWHIQMQFLLESFLLSIIGGGAGIVLGLIISIILANVMGTDFVISVGAIVLGAGFSAAVGILFGWAPARKASRLNPIDALRSN